MKRGLRMRDVSKHYARLAGAIAQGAPELLTDEDLQDRVRAPRKKPVQREKREVQQPLVVYLRKHLPAGSLVKANIVEAEAMAIPRRRFAMLRDGAVFGWTDLDIIVPSPTGPRYFHIENKDPEGGRLSKSQEEVQAAMTAIGCHVLPECRALREAVDWLIGLGVTFR